MKLLVVALAIFIAGCQPQIESGTITDKKFIPAHEETYTATEYGCGWGWGTNYKGEYNYDFGCGRQIQVTRTRQVPDAWTVTFERCDNGEDCRSRTLTIDETTYHGISVGNYYYTGESED